VVDGQFVCREDTAEVLAEAKLPLDTLDQQDAHATRAANARLIAAAPDLLRSAIKCASSEMAWAEHAKDCRTPACAHCCAYILALDMAHADRDAAMRRILQLDLTWGPRPHFDGETYDAAQDQGRLRRQLESVRRVMADGAWRTLRELSEATGCPEASVSARLRDLRKPKFGSWTVERQRVSVSGGLYRYRVMA
jgi:hypothetical protein